MKQSRNLTRHVKELESLYEQIIEESSTLKTFEQEKNVSDELHPKDSGPDGIENNVEEPIEVDATKPGGSGSIKEDAEGEDVTEVSQSNENTEKTENTDINTNMSDKNIFDKLYSTIMEADDELGDSLDVEMGLGDEEEGLGDEGGDVTVTLTQDQVDVLMTIVDQLNGEADGDEIEDLDSGGDMGLEDENPFPEAVEAEHTSDGNTPGVDPSGLTGKGNKVPGEASKTKSGGASADSSGQEDGGKPKSLEDTVAKMTSTGNNKVGGSVTGGNQGLLT